MVIDAEALALIFAAYKAICWILDRYSIGDKRKQYNALISASKNNMREIIRMNHRQYCGKGMSIDEDELEHIEHTYAAYKALGGNGTADRWIEELRSLPRTKSGQD